MGTKHKYAHSLKHTRTLPSDTCVRVCHKCKLKPNYIYLLCEIWKAHKFAKKSLLLSFVKYLLKSPDLHRYSIEVHSFLAAHFWWMQNGQLYLFSDTYTFFANIYFKSFTEISIFTYVFSINYRKIWHNNSPLYSENAWKNGQFIGWWNQRHCARRPLNFDILERK